MKKTEQINVRVTTEVKKMLSAEAEAQDRPLAYIVNKILTNYVNEKKTHKE